MGVRRTPKPDLFADVHLISRYVENRIEQLRSGGPVGRITELGRPERDAILTFVLARRPEVSEVRLRTFLTWLPLAASRLGPRFLSPDQETPAAFATTFPGAEYARATRATGANCLGTFWRWWLARSGKEYPAWLRIRLEKWKPVAGPSDMLSREDVAKIADAALNFRDKAWIWALFNSGCRPGEVYQLRVGDVVSHDEGYIELRVHREKGSAPEPAPVYEDAVPALLAWLNAHPMRENPSAPLWVDLGGERKGRPATYRAMYKALESATRRAGIGKPVTAYALRRSRLTLLAKDPAISTSILEKVAGWVPGSNVARHYIHLSGKDVMDVLNARYGVQSLAPKEKSPPTRSPSKCGRCKTVNPSGAVYCMTCGGPLSLPAVAQIEEARNAEERLAELLRTPEAIEFLAKLLAEGGRGKSQGGRHSEAGAEDSPFEAPPSATRYSDGSTAGRRPHAQKVVPLSEAEGWIQSGYEFVAALGANRAILRPPQEP